MRLKKYLKLLSVIFLVSCHYVPTTTLSQKTFSINEIEGDNGTLTGAIIEELRKEGCIVRQNGSIILDITRTFSEGPLTYTIDTNNQNQQQDRLVPNGEIVTMQLSYTLKPHSDKTLYIHSTLPFAFSPPNVLNDAVTQNTRSIEYSLGQFATREEALHQAEATVCKRAARTLVIDILQRLSQEN